LLETQTLTDGQIYADARVRFVKLVRSLPAGATDSIVPACPRWTTRDIVTHLMGASADFAAGNFPDTTQTFEEWTQAQVARGHGRTLEQLLDEWEELAPKIENMIDEGQVPAGPVISDTVVHDLDVRGMAHVPSDLTTPGFEFAYRRQLDSLGGRINQAGLPGLQVTTESLTRKLGDGEANAAVSVSTYELSRALMSRRSPRQVAAFDWSGDSAGYRRVFAPDHPGAFRQPEEDVVEG
jgi:uncharacterized protein (TIGR03083 family)